MSDSCADPGDYQAYAHPMTRAALCDAIRAARRDSRRLRVRGASHSERGSVLTHGAGDQHLMLDRLTEYRLAPDGTVTAGAGISLGGDPHALGGARNPQHARENSLFEQLNRDGRALPITGGISHQTLAGFITNGAAGGSIRHSFLDAVRRLTLIDGSGVERTLRRGDPDFAAALVSLGLFGVLVEVELATEPRFDIVGLRSTQPERGCDFDLFGDPAPGHPTLVDFLTTKEYARALWWPQPGVERVELWEATRFDPSHARILGGARPPPQAVGLPRKGLQVLAGIILGKLNDLLPEGTADAHARAGSCREHPPRRGARATLATLSNLISRVLSERGELADALFSALRGGPSRVLWYPAEGPTPCPPASSFGALTLKERIVAHLINLFIALSPAADFTDDDGFRRRHAGHLFFDSWQVGLPMDNPIHERVLPVSFTELWLPMAHAPAAMRALKAHFLAHRLAGTGTFAIELYAAKACDAWLSPAYDQDVFRVDPFWFDDGDDAARTAFFTGIWNTLAPFEMRFHWGKALSAPDTATGVSYRAKTLAKLADFRALRAAYDPDAVFLSDYWRAHLGL